MTENPFRYTDPVPPEELIDRDGEAGRLLRLAEEANNSRVVAPRRYGKTSLLRRVASEMPRGWVTVFVDFFGVLTVDDIAQRIERAYGEQLTGRLSSWFAGLRRTLRPTLRVGAGPVSATVDLEGAGPGTMPLLERLALPKRLHERHGRRVLVVFDEFQDVLAADARVDAVVRSEIQHHGPAVSYVFAGSQVGMMEQLFGDRRRAFYGQASPVGLGPLEDVALAEHIADRFERTGKEVGTALGSLLALVRGHPQRAMLAAHGLWDAASSGRAADEETWETAYRQVMAEARDELRAVWTGLATGQRRVLAALARGSESLYGAQRPQGGSRGGAVNAAVRALVDRGEVADIGGPGAGLRIVDPLLAEWVRRDTPGA